MATLGVERWTRGAGSGGIGVSGAINEYRSGVLVGNFVEDHAGDQFKATGRHWMGSGQPFRGNSLQRASYTEYGKTGADLQKAAYRYDQELGREGIGADMLTRHGDYFAPRQTYWATLNQLTYGPHRQHGQSRVDTYVWNGGNSHDAMVPRSTQLPALLTTRKISEWSDAAQRSMYTTSTRTALHSAAVPAAESPSRTETLRTQGDDGSLAQIGRRPVGPHRDECDKTYRRTGLRGVYYPGNIA